MKRKYLVHLTPVSRNEKTGPIPVSTTDSSTCPPTCGLFKECYGKFGPLNIHWRRVDSGGANVITWAEFCDEVSRFRKLQLWRHNQAGDLPGDGKKIDADAMRDLVHANRGRRGFTFTHYPLTIHNVCIIRASNVMGFTINISCDSVAQADQVTDDEPDLPLVAMLPSTEKRHSFYTPKGRKVVVCPATYRSEMNCSNCAICYESRKNRAIIGFPAHGTKKKVIDVVLEKANV